MLKIRFLNPSEIELSISSPPLFIEIRPTEGRDADPAPVLPREDLKSASAPLAREIMINDAVETVMNGRGSVLVMYRRLFMQLNEKGLEPISLRTLQRRVAVARIERRRAAAPWRAGMSPSGASHEPVVENIFRTMSPVPGDGGRDE